MRGLGTVIRDEIRAFWKILERADPSFSPEDGVVRAWQNFCTPSRLLGKPRKYTIEHQAEKICTRRPSRKKANVTRDASDDDLGTEATEKVRVSRSERAATGHTAAGHSKHRRKTDEAEHWNGRDRTQRIHEKEVGWHMADRHTMVKADGSEPHMATHTTGTAHPAKRVETHMRVDEDGGRRHRTKRESDTGNVTAPGAAQPCASTSVEPSGAASISYRSKETMRVSAEAKSSFIQKGNFYDLGMVKKRKRDPGKKR